MLTALTRWTATLLAEPGTHTIASARFGYDRICGTAEIFGPDAAGGHVVRHDVSRSGWLLLVPAARPAAEPGRFRRGAGPTPPPERAPYLRRGRALRIRAS